MKINATNNKTYWRTYHSLNKYSYCIIFDKIDNNDNILVIVSESIATSQHFNKTSGAGLPGDGYNNICGSDK
jgi:hypothetical protein